MKWVMYMKTILHPISHEIVIKNSRFIGILLPIDSSDIHSYLRNIQEEYPKATHYCYATIYDQEKHSSDDGEPGGTAGMPILNVLEKEDLNHILAVVVRYFGGIKLGAGGLVRAYTKTITETLKNAELIELVPGYKVQIVFPYEEEKNVLYLLKNSTILSKEYLENITYTCFVDSEIYSKLSSYSVSILEECSIQKL